jgi:CubicO group peptidase (beta-lactamase class C family)
VGSVDVQVDQSEVRAAARTVLDAVAADPRYACTAHLHVRLGGAVLVDEHLRGPDRGDIFSVTKTVLALALGVAAARDLLPPLDTPVAEVLPELRGAPTSAYHRRPGLPAGPAADGPAAARLEAGPGPGPSTPAAPAPTDTDAVMPPASAA